MNEEKSITVWMFQRFSYEVNDDYNSYTSYIDMNFTAVKDTFKCNDEELELLRIGMQNSKDWVFLYRDSRQNYTNDILSFIEKGKEIVKREEEKEKRLEARNTKAKLTAAARKVARDKKKLEELKKKYEE